MLLDILTSPCPHTNPNPHPICSNRPNPKETPHPPMCGAGLGRLPGKLSLDTMRSFDPARGDAPEYCRERATEYFNAAVKVARAMKRHDPETMSAIGNVMVEVVPKMIMAH